jgi:hypothetical protein
METDRQTDRQAPWDTWMPRDRQEPQNGDGQTGSMGQRNNPKPRHTKTAPGNQTILCQQNLMGLTQEGHEHSQTELATGSTVGTLHDARRGMQRQIKAWSQRTGTTAEPTHSLSMNSRLCRPTYSLPTNSGCVSQLAVCLWRPTVSANSQSSCELRPCQPKTHSLSVTSARVSHLTVRLPTPAVPSQLTVCLRTPTASARAAAAPPRRAAPRTGSCASRRRRRRNS